MPGRHRPAAPAGAFPATVAVFAGGKEERICRPTTRLEALRRRPFVPFRLYISDGAVYDVRHPELFMLAPVSAVVGLPSATLPLPQVERYEIVDLFHIVRLEPLPDQTAQTDGATGTS